MANNWSGYPNGKIPLDKMTQIRPDLASGGYAQPDAANAFNRMAKDFQAATGVPLKFVEAYRSYDMQVVLRNAYLAGKGNVAAIPGTSNHGWGLAFDFAYPMTSWNTQGQAWFRANEARYGFSSAQGVGDDEPWHKVYVGSTTTAAGGNSTPIQEAKDIFMQDAAFKSDSNSTVYLYIVETGGVRTLSGPEWTILTSADPTLKATVLSVAQTSAIVNGHLVDRVKGK